MQQELVVERRTSAQQRGGNHEKDRLVPVEMDALASSDEGESEERYEDDGYPEPLPRAGGFAQQQHGQRDRPERAGGADRRGDRER